MNSFSCRVCDGQQLVTTPGGSKENKSSVLHEEVEDDVDGGGDDGRTDHLDLVPVVLLLLHLVQFFLLFPLLIHEALHGLLLLASVVLSSAGIILLCVVHLRHLFISLRIIIYIVKILNLSVRVMA